MSPRKSPDLERLLVAFLAAQVHDLDPGAASRLWRQLHTNPTYATRLLTHPLIAQIYVRLGLSPDRRAMLDKGQWT